jgi:diamine N-acetyltransferase
MSAVVTLRQITDENRDAVAALRVGPGQEAYVATVEKSYRDAAAEPGANPGCAPSTRPTSRSAS